MGMFDPSGPPTALTALMVAGVPTMGIGGLPFSVGNYWFVNTVLGSDGNTGQANSPFATMGRVFTDNQFGQNDVVCFTGKIREQLVAPLTGRSSLPVTGVRIIGIPGGNVRDDDGAKWYAPASPTAGQALIRIRQQGWEFHNFLMSPDTTSGACIDANRAEDATNPDSSHFILRGMRLVGTGGTTYGVKDIGGNHHYIIEDCEFQSLAKGIYCSSTSIAVPLRNTIRRNKFFACTADIESSQSYGIVEQNHFMTPGSGAKVVVNVAANAGQGGINQITWNWFNNTEAEIAPANGYTGLATDLWMNYVNNQAALAFGQPA